MPQPSVDDKTLSQLLQLICEVEGIAAAEVAAVTVHDGEIEVKVASPSGRNRTLVYPLAALRHSVEPTSS